MRTRIGKLKVTLGTRVEPHNMRYYENTNGTRTIIC
jgi:hypothetical protein